MTGRVIEKLLAEHPRDWKVVPCVEYRAPTPSTVKSDVLGDASCPSYSRSGIEYKPYRFRLLKRLWESSKCGSLAFRARTVVCHGGGPLEPDTANGKECITRSRSEAEEYEESDLVREWKDG